MLNIFRDDAAFSVASLSASILKAPFKPGRLGSLALFRERGITTTSVIIEEKDGRLSLITSTPRGGPASTYGEQKRTARSFVVPHLQRDAAVLADQLQNVRAFGSEDATAGVVALVNEYLTDLRAAHEVTLEHLRVGAIKGQVLDGDGSTLLDLFTGFDVTQTEADLNISGDDLRNDIVAAQREAEEVLGAEPVTGYRAFCGDHFFDAMIGSEPVRESLKFQESVALRSDLRGGFEYGGVVWENYRGNTGGTPFIPTGEAYMVPMGTNIFVTYFAPADFIETVNTVGLPIYAKQVPDELGRAIKLHTQSNPLCLCLRPDAVVKLSIAS